MDEKKDPTTTRDDSRKVKPEGIFRRSLRYHRAVKKLAAALRPRPRWGIEDFPMKPRREWDLPEGGKVVEDPYVDLLVSMNHLGLARKKIRRVEKFQLPPEKILKPNVRGTVLPPLIIRIHWSYPPRFQSLRRLYARGKDAAKIIVNYRRRPRRT